MSITVARRLLVALNPVRSGYCLGLSALLVLFGCESLQNAVAEGDTRTISFHHIHTNEDLTITYKVNGRYDEEALKKINWELRDWRKEEAITMDPHLIDLVWEVRRDVGATEPISVVCGYRSPGTNAMLRRRSNGVAKFSQHMLGKAMDFYIPGVPLEQLRAVGLFLQRGGVGFYPTSGSPFVHLDTGNVRHWPGIASDQMPRWMAKGRELHVAAAGRPANDTPVVVASFTKRKVESVTPAAPATPAPAQVAMLEKPAPAAKPVVLDKPVPMPQSRPAGASKPVPLETAEAPAQPAAAGMFEVASLTSRTVKLPDLAEKRPAQAASLLSVDLLSPNQVIGSRGFFQGLMDTAEAPATTDPAPTPAAKARPAAKRQAPAVVASADPETTGSLTPWSHERDPADGNVGALAYAAPAVAPVAARPAPMGANLGRSAQPDTTIAVKRSADHPAPPRKNAMANLKAGDRFNDPWLRAMIVSPDVHHFMSTSMMTAPDYRNLAPLMQKPAAAVMMTFSEDPYLGLSADKFNGSAVVFVSTVTFQNARTASLR